MRKVGVVARSGVLSNHLIECLARAGYEVAFATLPETDAATTSPWLRLEPAGAVLSLWRDVARALEGCDSVHYLEPSSPDDDVASYTTYVGRAVVEAGASRLITGSRCAARDSIAARYGVDGAPRGGRMPAGDRRRRHVPLGTGTGGFAVHNPKLRTATVRRGELISPIDVARSPVGADLLCFLNGVPSDLFAGRAQLPIADVRDVAAAHRWAGDDPSAEGTYLVAGSTLTAMEWMQLLSAVTGLPVVDRFVPTPFGAPLVHAVDALADLAGIGRRRVRASRPGGHALQPHGRNTDHRKPGTPTRPLETSVREAVAWSCRNRLITDDARLAIVQSALVRASYDAAQSAHMTSPSAVIGT
jgi:hypothetical protein